MIYRSTILLMLFTVILLLLAVLSQWQYINTFIGATNIGNWGIALVALVFLVFFLGYVRIFILLLSYNREDKLISILIERWVNGSKDAEYGLPATSVVVERLRAIQIIVRQKAEIDHSSLAAVLSAREAAKFSLIRFVQNTLILTGVLGTMISLSVVLVGSAKLLNSQIDIASMTLVIGGMSTALITTVVAIVLYAIYSYFHIRLQDLRTFFLSRVEQITAMYFIPHYQQRNDINASILKSIDNVLVKSSEEFRNSVEISSQKLGELQHQLLLASENINQAMSKLQNSMPQENQNWQILISLIREGFRLPEVEAKDIPSLKKSTDYEHSQTKTLPNFSDN